MRTFIAIDFSPAIIDRIAEVIKYFKTQTPDQALKWVSPENLHLTIKFLGDGPDKNIDSIKALISGTLQGKKAFNISVEGLGMYPNQNKPRVIWLGIKDYQPLSAIHKALDQALVEANVERDRRGFSPHLTIARIRGRTDFSTAQEIGKTLSQFKVDSLGSCLVEKVCLYKSVLTPEGPIYTKLLSSPLDKV